MKKTLTKIITILLLIYILILASIIAPYKFLEFVLKEYVAIGTIFIFVFIYVMLLMIKIFIKLKNRLVILKNKDEGIYIRDVEVEYSPAVLSYLMNGKIESQKDLSATLLNLCAKNVIKLEKNKNGKVDIIDLKNNKEVEKLSADEKYAYKMFIDKMDNETIVVWKEIVKNEYEKYNFSKTTKKSFEEHAMLIFAMFLVIITFISLFIQENRPDIMEVIFALVVIGFFAVYEIYIFKIIRVIITRKFEIEKLEQYTVKGAKEYIRWQRFIKFIKDYTLVKDKKYDSIIILGKYLSYSISLGINNKCDSELLYEVMENYMFDINIFFKMFDNLKYELIE